VVFFGFSALAVTRHLLAEARNQDLTLFVTLKK
jgi:hypothetical protein